MALLPTPLLKMPIGSPGAWANMEECNSFTAFADSEFAYGVPLAFGAANTGANMGVVPLTTTKVFVGVSLANNNPTGTAVSGSERYGVGDCLGVADEGVVFVRAGASVTKGAKPFYDPATLLWHGASASGRLPIPGARFDHAAASGQPVTLKFRVEPGAAAVTAVS